MENKMDQKLINSADIIGMFCRLKMNTKHDLPIRSSEMGALIFVQKQEGEVTPSMISDFFKIAKPSVTSMVSSLVKKGYLDKIHSEIDKRSYTLRMTRSGNELLDSTFIEYYRGINELREKMGKEAFNQFIELMQMANDILEERK